jgi:hypothetical protein
MPGTDLRSLSKLCSTALAGRWSPFRLVRAHERAHDQNWASPLTDGGVPGDLAARIVDRMTLLNGKIEADLANLSPGFCIGHSFFVPSGAESTLDEEWYLQIIETEIVPLLQEYWFDDSAEAERWRHVLLN